MGIGGEKMFKYTICFIKMGSKLLMLNRNKRPTMGLWNGVGGKIENTESPKDSIIREIYEETGLQIDNVIYKGVVSWDDEATDGGMYAFLAEIQDFPNYKTPKVTDEGILEWKEISWIINPDNRGVPAHVPHFLPYLLQETTIYKHECTFENGKLIKCKSIPLELDTYSHSHETIVRV